MRREFDTAASISGIMARNDHGTPREVLQPDAAPRSAMPQRRSAKAFWANLFLLSASLAIAVVACELLLRSTHYRYLTHPSSEVPRGYYVEDPELGADLAPNYPPATFRMRGPSSVVFTNQWGCFDRDDPVSDDYLLAIGDSSTWGYAALEDKWTTHLETLSGRRVLKCGVSGTGPKYQAIKARKTIAKVGVSPAIILVLYDKWNDLNDDVLFPDDVVVDGHRGSTSKSLDLRNGHLTHHTRAEVEAEYRRYLQEQEAFSPTRYLTEHLTTAAMLREAFDEVYAYVTREDGPILTEPTEVYLWTVDTARYPWVVEAFEEHLDNIRALRRMAEEQGAELVLITDNLPDTDLRARLRAFFEAEFRYYIDVAEPIERAAQGRQIRHHHDGHWNALGNRLAGEVLHRYLVEAGLI
jgi:hypothetical protein